jgi:hypothetical protein
MVAADKVYSGKGYNELYSKVLECGSLLGEIVRVTGDKVASVEFSIEDGSLILRVNGKEYSSITTALSKNYKNWAINSASGSEGSGDIANNIIGNYAILKHVFFDKESLYDIIGRYTSGRRTVPLSTNNMKRSARIRSDENLPANEVFFEKYTVSDAKMLQEKFGRELVIREFNILTLGEFELRYGL